MREKHAASPFFAPARLRSNVTTFKFALALGSALVCATPLIAFADPPGDPTAVKQDENGIWRDKNGDPTFKVSADGGVDWYTYSGFRRGYLGCRFFPGPHCEG